MCDVHTSKKKKKKKGKKKTASQVRVPPVIILLLFCWGQEETYARPFEFGNITLFQV